MRCSTPRKPPPHFLRKTIWIIDEGQDLAAGFFRYASTHAAAVLSVFADEDQALGDRRTTLKREIKEAANLPNPVCLRRIIETHRRSLALPSISMRVDYRLQMFREARLAHDLNWSSNARVRSNCSDDRYLD